MTQYKNDISRNDSIRTGTMAPKRPREDDAPDSQPKKQRSGFKVGPDNLPDGTWKRKGKKGIQIILENRKIDVNHRAVVKIKKDLIHKAKVKKSYAKLKAREPDVPITPYYAASSPTAVAAVEPSQKLHPERQAMLDVPREPTHPPQSQAFQQRPPRERRKRRPGYFEKEEAYAEQKRAEVEARMIEFERRDRERKQKIEERERFRKAMAKARSGGKNGQRKLGKESQVLLEKVKRMMGE